MPYITVEDYKHRITDQRLAMILDGEDATVREAAEQTAVAVVRDALHTRYNVSEIFAKQAADRDKQVLRWVITLTLYFLYERIPDKLVPERIVKNYDDTMHILLEIEDGKMSVDLPRLTNNDGAPKTKFRWGSEPRRSHDV